MKNSDEIKTLVKEKYGSIAKNSSSCCGSSCGCGDDITSLADSYEKLEGYNPDADLSLGCGLPTEHANIKKGDTVVDLGSGAGNDVFVARAIVGEEGKVIGVDMTPEMVAKARKNALKLDYNNVQFLLGEIENLPVADNTADVVVSNCVLNLVPDKQKAFREAYRILKPGAHFCISDVVTEGRLPEKIQDAAELFVGCIGGAMQKGDYLKVIEDAGFKNIQIKKEKRIDLPDEVIAEIVSPEIVKEYRDSGAAVYSITVYGEK